MLKCCLDCIFDSLNRLYMNGWTMPLEKLYPPINYPVSRGTAKISPLLRWDHSVPLFVSKFELSNTVGSGERRVKINLANEDYAYITGHTVDGNYWNLFYSELSNNNISY